ncbi:patatin-like phospholipase [Desulfuromonas soudanensis]|uniref:Patatin-like phospholipase n=1 Tax=Desulfuromonas soudanensis TaxID=1603606 RepID=A0A0M4CZL1_9BACT|nr:patatin-like phospholipase family protein [Desulfuromonas soudanensis]ALC14851.1 patatin-like phospholipase [Desulfuromonas soudanensis]
MSPQNTEKGKTALVLAGGGIMGAAYEIGALTALDRLLSGGFSSNRFEMYVGVSAGSVIATLVANGIPPAVLFRSIANNESRVFNWRRSDIYRIDYREILTSFWALLRNLFRIFRNYRRNGWSFSLHEILYILQEQFPSGLFSLAPMQNYLCRSFAKEGVRDDFSQLTPELYIPAYDLDRGQRVVFGCEGYRDMHICQAITASCAIPYFFRPHKIGNQNFIDGSIGRVSHIDIAIERGAKLIVVVNPRVPMDNDLERFCLPSLSEGKCSSIADLGISFAWEQAMRIETKEKLEMALEGYRHQHPEVDILLIEPGREESMLFFQSPMSNDARHHIMNYGYNLTLGQLKDRFDEFESVLGRHGVEVTAEHLSSAPPAEVVT